MSNLITGLWVGISIGILIIIISIFLAYLYFGYKVSPKFDFFLPTSLVTIVIGIVTVFCCSLPFIGVSKTKELIKRNNAIIDSIKEDEQNIYINDIFLKTQQGNFKKEHILHWRIEYKDYYSIANEEFEKTDVYKTFYYKEAKKIDFIVIIINDLYGEFRFSRYTGRGFIKNKEVWIPKTNQNLNTMEKWN
jgi:hypothetical protein